MLQAIAVEASAKRPSEATRLLRGDEGPAETAQPAIATAPSRAIMAVGRAHRWA
jgi:hypothetical protein